MPDKKITEAEVGPEPTETEVNNSKWLDAIAEWKAEAVNFRKEITDLKAEMRATENRLIGRISVLNQQLTSPAGTFATNKLPAVGDTIGDAEVMHVSAGVPGISGPSVVTRGKD